MNDGPGSASGLGNGARRHLTLLFADLCDSTELGEAMEAEHYAAMLDGLRRACREIVPRHGGQIARIQGDGVFAFFGWPEPREDDGRRAAEAALDLHAAIARLGNATPLPPGMTLRLHSGIHAGLVLLAEGDVERGRFELLGPVPNIAARLCALAGRDDIVMADEALGPQVRYFVTSEPEPVQVRGRETPLAVRRVLARAAPRQRIGTARLREASPFVGRERELRALREHLRAALAGTNRCCVVAAAPGMGKSRLVEELLRSAADERCRMLHGACDGTPGAAPLLPFAQAIGAWLADPADAQGIAPERIEPVRRLFDAVAPARGDAAVEAVATLCALLDALAAQRPLVIVLDDWQWADEASQHALELLRTLPRPVLVLIATRGSAAELQLARRAALIELPPLDDAASRRLASALLPSADPFVIADIQRDAGGMPLYLEELCHAAKANGTLAGTLAAGARPGGGAWLAGLVESRVARLPAEQAAIVRAAAVIGTSFPAWLLERVAGCGADDPALVALAQADLLYPGDVPGSLRFKHGLTRDVIRAAIGLHAREALHGRIADALAADGEGTAELHVEALAYHCGAAGRHAEAARHAERAGDKALAVSALDRARVQYAAALGALDASRANVALGAADPLDRETGLRWCAVVQKLGLACTFDPLSLPDALAKLERGVALARRIGELGVIARSEYWLAYAQYAKGMAIAAQPHCHAALDLALQCGDARLASLARGMFGQVLISRADYDRALPLIDAALAARRPRTRPGVPDGACYTLANKGLLLGDRGRFADAEECFAEALQLAGDAPHQVASSVRHWLSLVLQWQGRWEEAVRTAEASAQIAEIVRSRHQLAVGRSMEGFARWVTSHKPEDLQMLRDATAWIAQRAGGLGMSLNHGWMVDAALATGQEAEARHHAARMFRRNREDDRIGVAFGCRALARRASKLNQRAQAERYLGLAQAAAAARGSPHERAKNQLSEAQIRLDSGQPAQARALVDQAMGAFERMAMGWYLERARRLVQRIG